MVTNASTGGNQLGIVNLTNLSGGTLSGGTYNVTGNGDLRIDGFIDQLNAKVSVNGSGEIVGGTDINDNDIPAFVELNGIGSGGELNLLDGHTETIDGSMGINGGGRLTGVGTINGDVTNGGGSVGDTGEVSPGTSPGTLTVNGDYEQVTGGTLTIDIEGEGDGQFDVLNVIGSGDIDLGGAVALKPSTAWAAAAQTGDFQAFISYTGLRSGTFASSTVTPPLNNGRPYNIQYEDGIKNVLAVVGPAPVQPPPPDADGDGVPDSSDACPTQAGPASNGGCPVPVVVPPPADSDGDGVVDTVDACPTVAGLAALSGCPKSTPSSLSQSVTPSSDSTPPYQYTVKGTLGLTAAAAKAGAAQANPACSGKVRIVVKRGRKRVARKSARVKSNCTYRKKFTFSAKKLPGSGKLKFKASFRGNALLNRKGSRTRTVSFG